jgi:hypothetical protein
MAAESLQYPGTIILVPVGESTLVATSSTVGTESTAGRC